ncbi:hypothetical protein [Kibdelosporangium philippinense]|uniref:hypothetical protein n=1 Tax=Kibdelosporangium philippinense TaxID=211113 RepID=UPI003612DC91
MVVGWPSIAASSGKLGPDLVLCSPEACIEAHWSWTIGICGLTRSILERSLLEAVRFVREPAETAKGISAAAINYGFC